MTRLERTLVFGVIGTVTAIALACAPGLSDRFIVQLPASLRDVNAATAFFVWGFSDAVTLPKVLASWLLAPLLAGLGILLALRRPRWNAVRVNFALLIVVLAAWTTLANALGIWPALGWESDVTLCGIALVFALMALSLDAQATSVMLGGLSAPALAIAIYSLCQHFGLDVLGWDPAHSEAERSISTFGNPDYFAVWLASVWPLMIWRASAAASPSKRGFWGIAVGLVTMTVIFSYTRAAWLAVLAASVVIAFHCRPRFAWQTVVAFSATCLVLWIALARTPHSLFSVTDRITDTFGADKYRSVAVRRALWGEALDVARDNALLGTGLDSFSYAAMPYRAAESSFMHARVGVPGDPHNAFLELLVSCGLPGLLLLLTICATCWRALHQVGQDGPYAIVARYLLVCGVAFCAGHLWVHATVPALWLGFLLAAACVGLTDSPTAGTPLHPGVCFAVMGLSLAGMALAVHFGLPMARADVRLNLARTNFELALSAPSGIDGRALSKAVQCAEQARADARGMRQVAVEWTEGGYLARVCERASPLGEQRRYIDRLRGQAQALLFDAVRDKRVDPYLWSELARVLISSVRHDRPSSSNDLRARAIDAARQSCAIDPFNAALRAELGADLAICGQFKEAVAAFRESLVLAPQQVAVRVELARALLADGERAAAVDTLREVVRRDPGNAAAVKLLSEIDHDAAHGAGR